MNGLRALLSRFLAADPSQDGYRQPPMTDEKGYIEPETLSASVNLEDIIDEYDEPSRRSRNTNDVSSSSFNLTTATSNPGRHQSQSFFSLSSGIAGYDIQGIAANGRENDETTSFYSALHDGFSLDEFELRNKYGREFLWNTTNSGNNNGEERDMMLQRSDFQVIWSDLTYTVRPRSTFADVWDDFKKRLTDGISSAPNLCSFYKSKKSLDVSTGSVVSGGADASREAITILKDVNGSFKSGELTAVLGPSGAGKTSLLNILSRRRDDGFTGRVDVTDTNHRITINAIPQDDHLLESLKVRENLEFASRLKNPHPNQDHEKNVCKVSNLLGLDECLDTRTSKISGGQQKRLAIAQELLSKPDILILDEPTSGLDSLTCLKTLSVLKDLVKASKKKMIDPIAIVFTIHQPQREAFELFDKVYVMANGGITIYDGPPSECTKFIESYSGLKMPHSDYNPASFLVEIASGEFGQAPIDALARQVRLDFQRRQDRLWTLKGRADKLKSFTDAISLSIDYKTPGAPVQVIERTRSTNDIDRISTVNLAPTLPVASRSAKSPTYKQQKPRLYLDPRLVKSSKIDTGNFCLKTKILTERCWKSLWRDPKQVIARAVFHLLLPFGMAFIMGTEPGHSNACPHFQSEYSLKRMMISDEYISPSVQEEFLLSLENIGVLFVSIYSCISANIAAMTLVLALDMRNCLKEYHNGWYSMNSYVFARIISNIPIDLILPTATIGLTYFATEQKTGTSSESSDVYRIIITALAIIIGSMTGQIMGMMFGAIYARHITTAMFASQGATLPFVLLSGFVARTKNMSKFVRALSFTSLYKHCLEVTFIARYGYNVCGCHPKDVANSTVVLTGVSDDLRNFVKYWMNSQDEGEADTTTAVAINPNDTGLAKETGDADADVFQMVAKQLSLYNTYGVEVKSCADVKSYQLYDFGLSESDLPASFAALITLMISSLLILLLIVKLVVSYRTSL